jgi:hypothetical protein
MQGSSSVYFALLFVVACTPATTPADRGPPAPVVEVVTKQEILTPLPMRVQLPVHYGAERVVALFHTWGSRDWGMVELARYGQTWSGEVSCREVSTVTGDTRYFFLALDQNGTVVADSGKDWPYVATIVGKLRHGPRGLPGSEAPARCHDPADCPPDFPGCPHYAWLRTACRSDDDCSGTRCDWDNYCGPTEYASAQLDEDERFQTAVRRAARRFRIAGLESGRLRAP